MVFAFANPLRLRRALTKIYFADNFIWSLVVHNPWVTICFWIILQFCLILIINRFYLKQPINRSDIIAFFIILAGFFVSFIHIVSKVLNIPIPAHPNKENPDEASASLKSQRYGAIARGSRNELESSAILTTE